MAKKIKKGTKGKSSKFISRAKSVKRLDIPLKDFRKLCILKGVHPREPPKRPNNNNKTYYHVKDIRYLAEDKLLQYFRAMKIYRRKLHTAVVKRDVTKVKSIKARKPQIDISHVVKERYPRFEDALRDLDDPLTSLALLTHFPSHRLFKINPEKIELSKLLLGMFKALVVRTKRLSKVFLSTRGIYYQVEIKGNKINWVEPYPFAQKLPFDVDYKVILSFSEFYSVLLKFVLFRLYKENGLVFPANIKEHSEADTVLTTDNTGFLNFITDVDGQNEDTATDLMESEELRRIQTQDAQNKRLFENLVFFISREVNKDIFEFCIKSFGGKVLYHCDNFDSDLYNNSEITHVITDRPSVTIIRNREYVQPQWICDSINNNILLPVLDYASGKSLPPHLSPFVDDEKEGYIPERRKEIMKIKGEYEEAGIEDLEDDNESEQENNKVDYEVQKETYNYDKEVTKKQIKTKQDTKEMQNLAEMRLTKKKKRLLDKIKNFDENKKQKIKELVAKKKALKEVK